METRLKFASEVCEDIFAMFQKEIFTDVTLRCGQEVFKAHKSILSARSPAFAAMFQSDMKESRQNSVEIRDMDSQVLEVMLEYIYSGRTDDKMSVSKARELLAASDLYQLPGLKSACVGVLESSMNLDNALCILLLGNLYEEKLKSRAVKYICDHFEDFESSSEWIALKKEEPSLVLEIMSAKIKCLKGNSHTSRAYSQKYQNPLSSNRGPPVSTQPLDQIRSEINSGKNSYFTPYIVKHSDTDWCRYMRQECERIQQEKLQG